MLQRQRALAQRGDAADVRQRAVNDTRGHGQSQGCSIARKRRGEPGRDRSDDQHRRHPPESKHLLTPATESGWTRSWRHDHARHALIPRVDAGGPETPTARRTSGQTCGNLTPSWSSTAALIRM